MTDIHECIYCQTTEELRPYGPHGSDVCFDCGTSPEHEEETNAIMFDYFRQITDGIDPEGHVLVFGDGMPRVVTTEEARELGYTE